MVELEPILHRIGPSKFYNIYFLQDVVLLLNQDLLEPMVSVGIRLDDISIVLSNGHFFELNSPTIECIFDMPFEFLTICGSLDIGIDGSSSSSIECKLASLMTLTSFVDLLTLRMMSLFL